MGFDTIEQGFLFRFLIGGGMVPPLRGGTRGGDRVPKGGGIARDAVTTYKFN